MGDSKNRSMDCPFCGEKISKDQVICPHCHRDLKTNCPACGEIVRIKWTSCPYCGAKIESQSERE